MIQLAYPRCILLIKPKTRAMSACVSLQGQLIANCYQLQRNATYSSTIKKATFHYHLSARRCLASEDDSCGISPFTLGTCCTHEAYITTKTAKSHFSFNTDLRGRPGTRGVVTSAGQLTPFFKIASFKMNFNIDKHIPCEALVK